MSLFDSIQFDYKLPLPADLGELTAAEIQAATYQTKSLDNSMTYYKVDESGQLLREMFEGEWKKGDKKGDKKAKSVMARIGYFERTKEWTEPFSYTGEIEFYELFQSDSRQNDYWADYKATFINGKVSDIRLAELKIESNSARKARDEIWKEELRKSNEFLNRWYVKYTYTPYSRLVRLVFRSWNRLLMKLPSQWQVERFLAPW